MNPPIWAVTLLLLLALFFGALAVTMAANGGGSAAIGLGTIAVILFLPCRKALRR